MKPLDDWNDQPRTDLLHGERQEMNDAEARTRQWYKEHEQHSPLPEKPETFNARVSDMLREHASCAQRVRCLMGQVLLELDDNMTTRDIDALKSEIKALVEQHFPDRTENISIVLREPNQDDTAFKVWKPA
ncbi:hypothetical protein C8P68_103306 [Mucilaginibacter yixingensis]|uniref:Uncharacterized protein n=1 Tax=Mucilaginibacter yixingensis TaxID=1295612 RepID=A0A2T5JBA3_9SPHI|nr:hypothetical protein [Mucilaginibacter yixingensis]PTQ98146.1 hypothetical protein C8P68_103306 [Mucilaginibacter yixingensis]